MAEDTRSPSRPTKRVRMSTSVGIAASESSQPPASAQDQQATQSAGSGAKQSRGKSVALASFPAEVQRVMQAAGHLEPTPVQIRQGSSFCDSILQVPTLRQPPSTVWDYHDLLYHGMVKLHSGRALCTSTCFTAPSD